MRLLTLVATTLLMMLCSTVAWGITFDVVLDPMQEIPSPVLGGATPSGTAVVDVNTITGEVAVSGTYTGLTSNAAASHLHGLAPAGTNAGVIFPLSLTGGTSGTLTGGSVLSATNLAGLLAGQTYLNVHTANNGPGEIRGQVIDPDIKVFQLSLDPSQSVPAPTLGGATPSGTATVVVDTNTRAVEISGTYSGMTSNVSVAHLHGFASPGTTAGVIFGFNVSGGLDGTFSGSNTISPEQLAGLLAGDTYINVHTANNGSGEIRAQVVPEPGSGLLGLTAVALVVVWRRQLVRWNVAAEY